MIKSNNPHLAGGEQKTQNSESLGWDPPVWIFLFFDAFGSPLKTDSFLPYVIFPFMNPFQLAICISSFTFPFICD